MTQEPKYTNVYGRWNMYFDSYDAKTDTKSDSIHDFLGAKINDFLALKSTYVRQGRGSVVFYNPCYFPALKAGLFLNSSLVQNNYRFPSNMDTNKIGRAHV